MFLIPESYCAPVNGSTPLIAAFVWHLPCPCSVATFMPALTVQAPFCFVEENASEISERLCCSLFRLPSPPSVFDFLPPIPFRQVFFTMRSMSKPSREGLILGAARRISIFNQQIGFERSFSLKSSSICLFPSTPGLYFPLSSPVLPLPIGLDRGYFFSCAMCRPIPLPQSLALFSSRLFFSSIHLFFQQEQFFFLSASDLSDSRSCLTSPRC